MSTPSIPLGELFTDQQLRRALVIVTDEPAGTARTAKLRTEIVEPRMDHINAATKQINDARYFSYVLEYALTGGEL